MCYFSITIIIHKLLINYMDEIEKKVPQRVGKERHGHLEKFTGCCTVLKSGILLPQTKPVHFDADRRWHIAEYMTAVVVDEHGMKADIGLLVPLKVLDDLLTRMHLPPLGTTDRTKHSINPRWEVSDDEGNTYINRLMLLAALNRNAYDILWQCDDENGRLTYDLVIDD